MVYGLVPAGGAKRGPSVWAVPPERDPRSKSVPRGKILRRLLPIGDVVGRDERYVTSPRTHVLIEITPFYGVLAQNSKINAVSKKKIPSQHAPISVIG